MAMQISTSIISPMTNVFADYVGRYREMHFAWGNSRDRSAHSSRSMHRNRWEMIYWLFFRFAFSACIISCDSSASRKRDSIDFYRYLAVELSLLPLPLSLSLSFALYGCRLPFLYSPLPPFCFPPAFRSPSPLLRASWLHRSFRATLYRQHPSRIPKEREVECQR